MDIASEISKLRNWLREDESRLQSVSSRLSESAAEKNCESTVSSFNDHSNWYNSTRGDPNPWKNFSNWTNGS